ncbi:MAG TPA: NAD-dependent epimerase/dehydratase family protein [bacterium]|nr:NAD-dependent epimerase/dehydratase family protein [bacterium]HQI47246.1 NAD-dependent epimerase/dehydratase family protein [bacterium]HQJ64245.1 NAD-dependent epimerase/dehydratase family protein [bacterium]
MRALVTGASGFTGGYMVDHLVERGCQVRAFVRPTSNTAFLKAKGVDIFTGDLFYKADLAQAMRNIDVVYHIAALYREANQPDQAYWDVNVTGTENVMAAALEMGVRRVLHCSTCGVHGHIEKPPATETAPIKPGDIYQETKAEGEKVAMFYHRDKGLPVTIVRPVGIYGPGDMRMLKMYRMIHQGKFIMFGGGNVLYHLSYVTDIVEGFRLAAETPAAAGEIYIIAGERWFTLNDFAKMVAAALKVAPPRLHPPVWPVYAAGWLCEKICIPLRVQPPIFRRRVDIFVKDRAFDISKAKRELGFQPKVGLEEGIHRTAQWYKENGYLD